MYHRGSWEVESWTPESSKNRHAGVVAASLRCRAAGRSRSYSVAKWLRGSEHLMRRLVAEPELQLRNASRTSCAARRPDSTAPSMKPRHPLALSALAKKRLPSRVCRALRYFVI